jgi:hypothetical protein
MAPSISVAEATCVRLPRFRGVRLAPRPPSAEVRSATMLDFVRFLTRAVADLLRARAALLAENALLRQQLIVARRKLAGRVRWSPWQRLSMVLASRWAPRWQSALLLVKPDTILRWHRAGFRAVWRWRSRPRGRPPTPKAAMIRRMARDNPLWGSGAHSRRAAQARYSRQQAHRAALHARADHTPR